MPGTFPRLSGPPEAHQEICSPADPTALGLPGPGMHGRAGREAGHRGQWLRKYCYASVSGTPLQALSAW